MRAEIDSAEGFRRLMESGGLGAAVIQGLDLRGEAAALEQRPATGAVFLGCELSDDTTSPARM